jgi:cytochrome P450
MATPPGPSSPTLIQTYHWLRRPYEFLDECAARYGEVFKFQIMGFGTAVVFTNPDCIKEIFAGSSDVFLGGESNRVLRPFVGEHSLLVLDGAPHHRQRKLLMPAFHGERMHAYGRAMLDLADDSIDSWPTHQPFPIHPRMQAVTLRVILRTIFGIGEGSLFERIVELTREAVEIASNPLLLFPFLQIERGGLGPWARFKRLSNEIDDILRAEIDRRKSEPPSTRRTDVLSALMEARDDQGQAMTFQELRDELVTMLVAGHETTATALAWTLTSLLRDPALCRRLREELAIATESGRLVPERVAKLELLDATVREGLRIRPVAPMVGRVLKQPIQLGGFDIPAGWVVAPGIYLAHRRTAVFPDPDRFDPERFLRARPSSTEWLPFGGGVRRCIGAAFASYEMKMVLAAILARATLRLKPGYTPKTVRRGVTMAPSEGTPVILSERKPAHSRDPAPASTNSQQLA